MNISEATEYVKHFKYPRHCAEFGCDRCPDNQMDACDKMCEAEDVISNEIKKLEDFKKVIESGIIKNAEVLKKQIDNQIEQFKKIKPRAKRD